MLTNVVTNVLTNVVTCCVTHAARQRDVSHPRCHSTPACPAHVTRFTGQDVVAACCGLTHHGKAAVFVGFESLERVGNKKQLQFNLLCKAATVAQARYPVLACVRVRVQVRVQVRTQVRLKLARQRTTTRTCAALSLTSASLCTWKS